MPEPIKPSEIEEILKNTPNVPEPNAEFLNSLRTRFIEEGHASTKKKQETQMRQKTFSRPLAWSMAVFVLFVLVAGFSNPTVVNALKRLFGYVPNVGIIDQTSEVRMLLEPVTVTRDNVIVTVEQAVLNNEKTVIVYSYIMPPDYVLDLQTAVMDDRSPFVSLPDGTRLDVIIGQRLATTDCIQCTMLYSMEFAPIPADVDEAYLELPSLVAVPLGAAPRDWKIQLKFGTADPSAIAPVIEQVVTTAPVTVNTDEPQQTANTFGITNSIDKFVALPDGYILYGNTAWSDPIIPPYGVSSMVVSIRDANGVEIPFEFADPEMYPGHDELRMYWAYKVGLSFTAPLTLNFGITASFPVDGGSFTFDPGANPQLGQKWEINQNVSVNNEVVHVLTAEQAGIEQIFFMFTMQSNSNIVGATIIDLVHPPMGGGGGGGGLPVAGEPFSTSFSYQVPIPQGPLTLTFTNVQLLIPGDWALSWSP